MIRDFSRAKKEEVFRALDAIEGEEWEPFLAWCGGRTAEFGEWPERLNVTSHTRRMEGYRDRIREVNDETRYRVEAVFEGAAEIDSRYAEAFRGHAETVREQLRKVQVMLQAMQSSDGVRVDVDTLRRGLKPQAETTPKERLERGQGVLRSYLRSRGITDPARQQEICSVVTESCPDRIRDLYVADCYGTGDPGATYGAIMDFFQQYERDRELARAESALDGYLATQYANSVEREFIIAMVEEEDLDSLLEWYRNDVYRTTDCSEVGEKVKTRYEERKKGIGLETIEERFRNDERVSRCDVVCEYLAYLEDLQYICRAERDRLVSEVREVGEVGSEKKEELCAFMQERRKLIAELSTNKKVNIGEDKEEWVVDGKWIREQIMCALQIEAELAAIGFEREFAIGLIGNMKKEGRFGKLEGTDHSGEHEYWDHVNDCIDYYNLYSNKQVTDIDLIKLYVDMVYKKNTDECENDEEHFFGMGAVQWTDTRCEKLMELYLQEAGLDIESNEFQTMVQNCWQNKPHEGVYLTEGQVRVAEVKMMKYELTEHNLYKTVYPSYQSERGGDSLENVKLAAEKVKKGYIQSGSLPERKAAAVRWYQAGHGEGAE